LQRLKALHDIPPRQRYRTRRDRISKRSQKIHDTTRRRNVADTHLLLDGFWICTGPFRDDRDHVVHLISKCKKKDIREHTWDDDELIGVSMFPGQ